MRSILQTSALLAVVAGCVPAPFDPVGRCNLVDEQTRPLFLAVWKEESRSCDALRADVLAARDMLEAEGFTSRDDFPRLVADVELWVHAGQEVPGGNRGRIGAYDPRTRTGSVPWVHVERWLLSLTHELLHHYDVEELGTDPEEELAHERWKVEPGGDVNANPYVVASDRWYWDRWAEKTAAGF